MMGARIYQPPLPSIALDERRRPPTPQKPPTAHQAIPSSREQEFGLARVNGASAGEVSGMATSWVKVKTVSGGRARSKRSNALCASAQKSGGR
jgi:hypothetical protein